MTAGGILVLLGLYFLIACVIAYVCGRVAKSDEDDLTAITIGMVWPVALPIALLTYLFSLARRHRSAR